MSRRVLLAVASLAACGCSLTGLSDYEIFTCGDHTQCEPLNERDGIADDACVRYQCATDERCRLQPRDLDRDGHADADCAGAEGCGELPCDDCDDGAAGAHPGLDERCDGLDNDCSGIVDDVPPSAASAEVETLVENTGALGWHAWGAPLEGEPGPAVSFGRPGAAFFQVVDRDGVAARPIGAAAANIDQLSDPAIVSGCPNDDVYVPAPPTGAGPGVTVDTCQDHADCSDAVLCNGFERCDPLDAAADASGCRPSQEGSPCAAGELCDETGGVCELSSLAVSSCVLAELATAEIAEATWLGAAVQQTACGGLVRVGYLTETEGDGEGDPGRSLLMRGDHRRSTSYRGVDVISPAGMGDCTGRSRGAGEPLGARSVALAALPAAPDRGRRRPQGLVAWLVPEEGGGRPVEVLGVWYEQFTAGGAPVSWVNATNDARPERLPALAASDDRPATVAFTSADVAGYLLAYGVADGGIEVRFVPSFADPAEVIDVAPYTTPITPDDDRPRTTDPIADLGEAIRVSTDGEARHVHLVTGYRDGGGAALGLAWSDDGGVRFATLRLDPDGGVTDGEAPRTLSDDEALELTLGFTPSGVLGPRFEWEGRVVDPDRTGGYLIAWRTPDAVRGARLAELDGARVPPLAMRLGGASWGRLRVGRTAGPVGRDVAGLLFHDADTRELRRLPVFCGP